MKVIKRDGRFQSFDLSKIETSIYRASDDANEPLNESDIHNLARSIEKEIQNLQKDTVHSYLIQGLVLVEIERLGFLLVGNYYNQGKLE